MGRTHAGQRIVGIAACVTLFVIFVVVFKASAPLAPVSNFTPENIDAAGGNTRVLSELLFSEYLLPFELTSVLLLAAIVAAVAIAKRHLANPESNSHSGVTKS